MHGWQLNGVQIHSGQLNGIQIIGVQLNGVPFNNMQFLLCSEVSVSNVLVTKFFIDFLQFRNDKYIYMFNLFE